MVERLVIVDDEEVILALLERVLRAPDRVIEIFSSAENALRAMRRQRPDAVITDLHMPGMTGKELIGELRAEFGKELGVVVISAFPSLVADVDDVADGIGAYLRKPFTDLETVRMTVAQVIANAGQHSPTAEPLERGTVDQIVRDQRVELSRTTAVMSQLSDGILVLDEDSRIVQGNPAAAQQLGIDHGDWLGRGLRELDLSTDMRGALGAEVGPEQPSCPPVRVPGRDATVIEVQKRALIGAEGQVHGSFVVLRDVTAELRVQDLRHHYLTAVSHELRTPLTALQNFVSLFHHHARSPLSERHRILLDGIQQQTLRLGHQINKLILLARLEREGALLNPELFDVRDAVTEALELGRSLAEEQSVALLYDACDEKITGWADREDLARAIYEVIENAIKFTPPSGEVRVSVSNGEDDVEVCVQDDGIGIDGQFFNAIFDDFRQLEAPHTRQYGGAGLGLALARRILESWGGRIRVESDVGVGSTFTLEIPRHALRAQPPAYTPELTPETT